MKNSFDESPALEGPDYVTLVIDWDVLADQIDDGISAASPDGMPTRDSDWIIDEASRESFPASDPPAWGSSHAAAESVDEPKAKRGKRRLRKPVLIGVISLFALTGILASFKWLRHR